MKSSKVHPDWTLIFDIYDKNVQDPNDEKYRESTQGGQKHVTLDYIWYKFDPKKVMVERFLEMPEKDIKNYPKCPLPGDEWPSDHLCLSYEIRIGLDK